MKNNYVETISLGQTPGDTQTALYFLPQGADDREILKRYALDADRFHREVPDLPGDWLLVDHTRGRFFTSAAFSGAYWCPDLGMVSKDVSQLLRFRAERGLEQWDALSVFWAVCFESSIHSRSSAIQLPMKNIRVLSGLMSSDDVHAAAALNSLLPARSRSSVVSAADFKTAMETAADDIAAVAGEVEVAFSGGKDCTAAALALRNRMGRRNVRLKHVVTFANDTNTDQARRVAEAYDLDLEVITPAGGWAYGGDGDAALLEETLSRSLTEVTAPYHAAVRSATGLLIDGQSMDAALSPNMNKAKQSSSGFTFLGDAVESAKNFQRSFYSDGTPQSPVSLARVFSRLQRLRGHDLERPGLSGPDLISQKARNIYKRYPQRKDLAAVRHLLEQDVTILDGMFDESRPFKNHYYYAYPALKLVYSLGIFRRPPVHFPYCRGFSEIWARGVSGRDMFDPKWQIQDYIEDAGGRDYNRIKFGEAGHASNPERLDIGFLLDQFEKFLSTEFKVVALSPPEFRQKLVSDFHDLHARLKARSFSSLDFQWAFRVLNYELLARNV